MILIVSQIPPPYTIYVRSPQVSGLHTGVSELCKPARMFSSQPAYSVQYHDSSVIQATIQLWFCTVHYEWNDHDLFQVTISDFIFLL
jgi:hypothetical protein